MNLCDAQQAVPGLENVVDSKDVMPDMLTAPVGPLEPRERPAIRVKVVPERDRRRLLMHFLALGESDRLLRFGSILPDEVVTRYVQHLDFNRDVVFGVYDDMLHLVGVGHLAFAPQEGLPRGRDGERAAEFGVSVSESARGLGVGTKMFERAAMHCRNADIDTLYMHCLSSNRVMMHIAKKAGMAIQRDRGEADAYLRLPPASPTTVLREAVEEQVASLDYTMKANARAAKKLLGTLPGFKG